MTDQEQAKCNPCYTPDCPHSRQCEKAPAATELSKDLLGWMDHHELPIELIGLLARASVVFDQQAARIEIMQAQLEANVGTIEKLELQKLDAVAERVQAENDGAVLRGEIARLKSALSIDTDKFEQPPCYICGYNGPGYFQPETHKCAAYYHAAWKVKEDSHDNPA